MSSVFHDILRTVAGVLELPVVILLIVFLALSVFSVGWIVTEWVTERRRLRYALPALLETLRQGGGRACIEQSGLLRRHKAALLELCDHPDFTPALREGLAANLLDKEQAYCDRILKRTELIAKLAPMFGLLGTLIPLGPGIIALGQGDTYTLSVSLLTAFDTTIAGLSAAAVCLVITTIRKRWYNGDLADLETLMDCVCQAEAGKCED